MKLNYVVNYHYLFYYYGSQKKGQRGDATWFTSQSAGAGDPFYVGAYPLNEFIGVKPVEEIDRRLAGGTERTKFPKLKIPFPLSMHLSVLKLDKRDCILAHR